MSKIIIPQTPRLTKPTRPGQTIHSTKTTQAVKATLGEIRLIGGQWRGRKLPVVSQDGLRPTADRVRETLFNWLQYTVPGARCLDVFSGSGALGLEALSRGAQAVTFLELSTAASAQLTANMATLKVTSLQAQVVQGDALAWIERQAIDENPRFDVVFLDPPFNQSLMQPAVDKLLKSSLLDSHQAWLYLEQEKNTPWPNLPNDWRCHRQKTTSQVRYGLFCRDANGAR
ncbi:16S rRNA (guanine(966)-N(2))-methyltransferase RsmD [Thiomicrorhabdus aquaedulcis]|uniref:16S rRNA (guanine(966)-N(2))-methyltransferase RsmD n=1 Tax=Thiomicrorhabdus aquaedulcis TaxID=2211106 RepID=UPI001E55F902|nr:16S rRNA (guanine(966)-N(2))-methyltransferase RsmD [Thiomicrorhabdus aquaedulcis]